MNFSVSSKPAKPVIPLWHPSLVDERVRRFRTVNALQYFTVFDYADAGRFVVDALDCGTGNGSWIFTVTYL